MSHPSEIPPLHVEEYKSLRAEIAASQAERRSVNRWGAAGVVGVYAWLLGGAGRGVDPFLQALGFFLPGLIAGLCLLQNRRLTEGIRGAGRYLAHLQRLYADPRVAGWEYTLAHFEKTRAAPQSGAVTSDWIAEKLRLNPNSDLTEKFWSRCLLITIGFGILVNLAAYLGFISLAGAR